MNPISGESYFLIIKTSESKGGNRLASNQMFRDCLSSGKSLGFLIACCLFVSFVSGLLVFSHMGSEIASETLMLQGLWCLTDLRSRL